MAAPELYEVLPILEDRYRQWLGTEPLRASVSFLGVEPIEILRFADPVGQTYLSLGMSRHAMTASDSMLVDARSGARAELMLSTVGATDPVWRQLAVMAAAPSVQSTVYQAGDRLELDSALLPGSRCTGAVLVASEMDPVVLPRLAPIELLQVLPATSDELAWARIHGTEKLRQRWREHGTSLRDLMRAPVSLT